MSSEATDEVDSVLLEQNSCDDFRSKSSKSTEEIDNSKAENSISLNKNLKKNGQRDQASLNSNNHPEKKLRPPDGSNNMKELSFFPDDEDSEGSSSPLNLKISTKWTTNNNKIVAKTTNSADDNNVVKNKDVNKISSISLEDDDKVDEIINSDHDGDASSTSSCSCEDHSSVAGHSNHEEHEDLDYDEDSISDSLPGTSNNTQEPNYPSSSSPSNNKRILTEGSTISNSDSPMSKLDDTHTSAINNNADDTAHEKNHTNNRNKSRIKSVINFNHDNDCESNKSRSGEKSSSDKSLKSYECLLKYFFKDACYFQIKSINHENVELSKSMGVWSTPVQNEIRLNTAFREHRNVILIFSVQQSGGFQGFARMISESRPTSRTVPWVLPERLSKKSLGGVLKVEWLCTKELPFHETQDLYNPYNDNKPVKIARDGQQVEPKIGKKLCKLFPRDSKEQLLSSLTTLKRQTSQRKKSSSRHDNFYPLTDRRGYVEERHRQNYIPLPGTNGIGELSVPSHISHEYNIYNSHGKNYRPIGRRRVFDHANHGIYHRQNPYPSQYGSPRQNHMPRNVDVMPRCIMPGGQEDFHQGYGPTNHHYPNPYETWAPTPEIARYHPYQRSRR